MRVFLIGFMGAGKSFLGKKAAKTLNMDFVDLDLAIETNYKMSIQSIFESFGEKKFREIEHLTLKELIKRDNIIISCGGGTPCFFNNMSIIKNSGLSIYLKMNEKTLLDRIKNSKNKRPIMDNSSNDSELLLKIKNLLQKREEYYKLADITYEAINSSYKDLVEIIKYYSQQT